MLLSVGELICPAYHELCGTGSVSVPGQCPDSCNFNGDCVDGRCHCFLGFHGHDCSQRELLYHSICHLRDGINFTLNFMVMICLSGSFWCLSLT